MVDTRRLPKPRLRTIAFNCHYGPCELSSVGIGGRHDRTGRNHGHDEKCSTMIVPGIVLDIEILTANHSSSRSTQVSEPETVRMPIGSKPAHGGTVMSLPAPEAYEPEHFVQLGGPAILVGTLVFSNPTIQRWVRGVLGWDEPTMPDGSPIAY